MTWREMPLNPTVVTDPRITAVVGRPHEAERLWEHYRATGPWIAEEDEVDGVLGHRVTVMAPAAADSTVLVLHTLTDRHREDLRPSLLEDIPGTRMRALALHLPRRLVCSYGLAELPPSIDPAHLDRKAWRSVVLATRPDLTPAPVVGHPTGPMSLLVLPGGEALAEWSRPRRGVAGRLSGELINTVVPAGIWPHPVNLWVHRPASQYGPSQGLLVLLDGDIWVQNLEVAALLDEVMAAEVTVPFTTVLPSSGNQRDERLGLQDRWADWLASDLLTVAREHAEVVEYPGRSIVAGQSLGGAAALHAALRHPERFAAVISQSGAFWWPAIDGVDSFALRAVVDAYQGPRLRVAHQVGTLEWHLLDLNREMVAHLRARGHQVTSYEDVGGHDAAIWRSGLVRALAGLLAPSEVNSRTPS